jgi:hypothetical protein
MTQQDNIKFSKEQIMLLNEIYTRVVGDFEKLCWSYCRKNRILKLPEVYSCFQEKLKEFKNELWDKLYVFPNSSITEDMAVDHIQALNYMINVIVDKSNEYSLENLTGKYKRCTEEALGLILEYSFIPKEM